MLTYHRVLAEGWSLRVKEPSWTGLERAPTGIPLGVTQCADSVWGPVGQARGSPGEP